jgi:hypothetical protein
MAARSIDAWFDALPEHWRERAQRIRELILEASPIIREGLKYGLPFYDHRKWMCYLALQKGQLVLGFTNGRHLLDPGGALEVTAHKLIRHYLPPLPPQRLNEAVLRALLAEAVNLNDALYVKLIKGR